jgi:pyruvate formate lyase activating enzyme
MGTGLASTLFKKDHALARAAEAKEALYYQRIDPQTVQCVLCPHQCILKDGQRSLCRVREPDNGKLYTLVYELPCSANVDPIEKKPIYHMLPGTKAFSIATAGCNLRCKFCQNWQLSQEYPENLRATYMSCESVVKLAQRHRCASVAYTYSEPTVFYEYMHDTAVIAKEHGIRNVWVTAGYINRAPLQDLCRIIDAANIDLKAFSDTYLQEVCNERLEPLLETIAATRKSGVWVELTNLVVPTLNDDMDMIERMCVWIVKNVGNDTPLHFSRFWPMYKLKHLPPTPVSTLKAAREIAQNTGLQYVYIGNVPGDPANNTVCPRCKKVVVRRTGYFVTENNIVDSRCTFCGYTIAGIWH